MHRQIAMLDAMNDKLFAPPWHLLLRLRSGVHEV